MRNSVTSMPTPAEQQRIDRGADHLRAAPRPSATDRRRSGPRLGQAAGLFARRGRSRRRAPGNSPAECSSAWDKDGLRAGFASSSASVLRMSACCSFSASVSSDSTSDSPASSSASSSWLNRHNREAAAGGPFPARPRRLGPDRDDQVAAGLRLHRGFACIDRVMASAVSSPSPRMPLISYRIKPAFAAAP